MNRQQRRAARPTALKPQIDPAIRQHYVLREDEFNRLNPLIDAFVTALEAEFGERQRPVFVNFLGGMLQRYLNEPGALYVMHTINTWLAGAAMRPDATGKNAWQLTLIDLQEAHAAARRPDA